MLPGVSSNVPSPPLRRDVIWCLFQRLSFSQKTWYVVHLIKTKVFSAVFVQSSEPFQRIIWISCSCLITYLNSVIHNQFTCPTSKFITADWDFVEIKLNPTPIEIGTGPLAQFRFRSLYISPELAWRGAPLVHFCLPCLSTLLKKGTEMQLRTFLVKFFERPLFSWNFQNIPETDWINIAVHHLYIPHSRKLGGLWLSHYSLYFMWYNFCQLFASEVFFSV